MNTINSSLDEGEDEDDVLLMILSYIYIYCSIITSLNISQAVLKAF